METWKYAAIHEFGGTIPPHEIVPDIAKMRIPTKSNIGEARGYAAVCSFRCRSVCNLDTPLVVVFVALATRPFTTAAEFSPNLQELNEELNVLPNPSRRDSVAPCVIVNG